MTFRGSILSYETNTYTGMSRWKACRWMESAPVGTQRFGGVLAAMVILLSELLSRDSCSAPSPSYRVLGRTVLPNCLATASGYPGPLRPPRGPLSGAPHVRGLPTVSRCGRAVTTAGIPSKPRFQTWRRPGRGTVHGRRVRL